MFVCVKYNYSKHLSRTVYQFPEANISALMIGIRNYRHHFKEIYIRGPNSKKKVKRKISFMEPNILFAKVVNTFDSLLDHPGKAIRERASII